MCYYKCKEGRRMKDPKNREMMGDLYRLFEKFEDPRDNETYWQDLAAGCCETSKKYKADKLTDSLLRGLMYGLEEKWRGKRNV
jgi:hypothetical protein